MNKTLWRAVEKESGQVRKTYVVSVTRLCLRIICSGGNKEIFYENLTQSNLLFPFPVSSVEEFLSIKKRRPKVLVDRLKATTWNKDISFLCTRHDSVIKMYHLFITTKTIDPPEISSLQRSSATFNLNITLNEATLYLFY